MKFKNKRVSFGSYMGYRWFISKALIAAAALFLLFQKNDAYRIAGFVLFGYLIGVIGANVRSYIVARKVQKEVIDRNKVEENPESNKQAGKKRE